MDEPRRLTRRETDRMVAGVAGGLAAFFGVDPTIVRLGFVVLTVFGGAGVLLYLVMWLIVPRESAVDHPPSDVVRENVAEGQRLAQDGVKAARKAYGRFRGSDGADLPPPPPPAD